MDTKPARLDAAKKKGEELVTLAAVNVQRSPEGEFCCSSLSDCLTGCVVFSEMERMRPIELDQFSEHVIQMHQDRDKGFELEYQVSLPPSLPPSLLHCVCCVTQCLSTDPVAPTEAAKSNKNKNRFANIIPCE